MREDDVNASGTVAQDVGDDAICRKCGYALRGLPSPTCPECGRPFDPLDERTFDNNSRRRRRRRKWIALAALVVFLLAGFAPRGLYRANIVFTCVSCPESFTVHWVELAAPRWLPLRYPGWQWTVRSPTASSPPPNTPCSQHVYGIRVAARSAICSVTGSMIPAHGEVPLVNGHATTPETARTVLKALTHSSNTGISLDSERADAQPQ